MTISVSVRTEGDHATGQFTSPEDLLDRLRRSGMHAALDALDRCVEQGLSPSGVEFVPVMIDISTQLLLLFNRDAQTSEGYAVLDRLSPALARAMFQTLMHGVFPDGTPDLAILNDSTVIVLGSLLSLVGEHANAVGFLGELAEQRAQPSLRFALKRVQRARASI
jgi:hypothetical protein